MAIRGLTHDTETGILNSVDSYTGKISTGYAPNEGPNNKNAPMAAGFFRMLKQVVVTKKLSGGKTIQIQEWADNKEIQDKLVKMNNNNEKPRRVSFICVDQEPEMIFRTSLSKFSQNDGLVCTSQGEGTVPMQLDPSSSDRERKPRKFDGVALCPYKECPDFKSGDCKAVGTMKIHPDADLQVDPYKFTTSSINTIMSITSSLEKMYNLSKIAHDMHFGPNNSVPFTGLFKVKMDLIHRKIKSGGRDVFVTNLKIADDFSENVMQIIKDTSIATQAIAGGDISNELLESPISDTAAKMLEE